MSKSLERAREFLDRVALVDGHNDLPWVIRESAAARGDPARYGLDQPHPETDTDMARLREGKVAAQFWAAFVPARAQHPARRTLEQIDLIRRMNEAYADDFLPAYSSRDIAKAKRRGKIASFLAVENGVGLENSLEMLAVFYDLGVRYMTLCHNGNLDWIDSATDRPHHNGLTDFGRSVVREMNRLGMMIDCAHVAPQAVHHVLDETAAPILVTHGNARALCDHPRNVRDDLLDRIKANGGMVMATFVPEFVSAAACAWGRPLREVIAEAQTEREMREAETAYAQKAGKKPKATLAEVCDHIEYMAKRMGADHVGIGSDFFGGPTPVGLEDVSKFPGLIAELMDRGWSETALAKLASRNFVRVFRAVEQMAARLKEEGAVGGVWAAVQG